MRWQRKRLSLNQPRLVLSKDHCSIAVTDNETFKCSHWTVIRTSSTHMVGERLTIDPKSIHLSLSMERSREM
ncbi:hypothetical protein VTN00DRAFT_5966 [Thermoascus crustaceus]|uniref:uncharacterized protein n=1 Tax=Thermoascus crustaceus TaxID=5088 RepID=UPI0037446868